MMISLRDGEGVETSQEVPVSMGNWKRNKGASSAIMQEVCNSSSIISRLLAIFECGQSRCWLDPSIKSIDYVKSMSIR